MFWIFVIALFFLFLEIGLRIQNPYRLWKDAFPESTVHEPDKLRGWRPKPNIEFSFYHRYLKGTRRICHNSLGLRDYREFPAKKTADLFRVLVFGETTTLGWELNQKETVSARLESILSERYPMRRFEVIPVTARNYSLGQLFSWYKNIFHNYEWDVLVYVFNDNNPRRSISFHESGKELLFTQPLYTLLGDGKRLEPPPAITHRNDMAFMNENWEPEVIRGHTRVSFHNWMRNHIHAYCALDDLAQGKIRLRNLRDRVEIKDIEQRQCNGNLPYQWQLCRVIFGRWGQMVKERNGKMLLVSTLQFYHAGFNRLNQEEPHPYGFRYEDIPSRKHLPMFAQEIQAMYEDVYEYARLKFVDTGKFYQHPRYGYFTPQGADFQAGFIADALVDTFCDCGDVDRRLAH